MELTVKLVGPFVCTCHSPLYVVAHVQHEGLVDREVVTCRNHQCPNYNKEFEFPTLTLKEVER